MNISIREEVYQKVMHWVDSTDLEVSGFGHVVRTKDGFEIISAHLLEQEVGATHTDIDAPALAKLMFQTKEHEGQLKWWWHSHVTMPVFWSGTDKNTIIDLGKNGWIIATVFNKDHETRSALCYKTVSDFGEGHQFDDDKALTILTYHDADKLAEWDAEMKAKVRKKTYSYIGPSSYLGADYYEREYDGRGNVIDVTSDAKTRARVQDEYNKVWNKGGDTYEGPEQPPGMTDKDWEEYGLWGYGAAAEARALKMSKRAYIKSLETWDRAEIQILEQQLELAEQMGLLKEQRA